MASFLQASGGRKTPGSEFALFRWHRLLAGVKSLTTGWKPVPRKSSTTGWKPVPPGSLKTGRVEHKSRWILAFFLLMIVSAEAHSEPADAPAPKADVSSKPVEKPIDQRPYRIRVFVSGDNASGLDPARLDTLVSEWLALVHRFVGAPWRVEVAPVAPESLASADPSSVSAETFALDWVDVDKVWLIKVRGEGSSLVYEGREYDVATRRLGPYQRARVPVLRDAARVFLRFTLDLFSPYATIGEHFGKDVVLMVQGGAIEPASEIGRVVSRGTVFQPLRVVQKKDGSTLIQEIALTYVRVEKVDGPKATGSLVSSFRDPFTKRVVQKNWLVAVGVKPGKSKTHLKFATLPDKAPAAGYVLTARRFPDGTIREVGTTDRQGRITLEPGETDGLTIFRLIAGSSEPMREFPLMPGASESEQAIPAFDPLPQAITLETRLNSLRDRVIDMVAIRARLEAQLKGRYDSEDFTGAEESLKEFAKLPPKSKFAEELDEMRKNGALAQSTSKSAVMTKTVQAQIAELEALIDRYLDDEGFNAFADALSKVKAEAAKAAVKKPEAKPKAPPAAVPPPAETPETKTAPPEKPAAKSKKGTSLPF